MAYGMKKTGMRKRKGGTTKTRGKASIKTPRGTTKMRMRTRKMK